jgi:hypothetical protein
MNERIKELAVQAGLPKYMTRELCPTVIERFADLVRADEREVCAKLCDDWLVGRDDICKVAKAIRARSDLSPAFKNYIDDKWAGIV